MADGKTEGDQSTAERKESTTKHEEVDATVSTVASSLAAMLLEHQVKKGREIEIPSLGIKVGKAKPNEPRSFKEHDRAKRKEEPPNTYSASS
jgi:hypothetical protein